MYTLSVPVTNWSPDRSLDCAATLKELRRAGAERVFLCVCRSVAPEAEKRAQLAALRQNIPFFEQGRAGSGRVDEHARARRAAGFRRRRGKTRWISRASWACRAKPARILFAPWMKDMPRFSRTGWSKWRARARGGSCWTTITAWPTAPMAWAVPAKSTWLAWKRFAGNASRRAQLRRLAFSGAPNRYRAAWLKVQRNPSSAWPSDAARGLTPSIPRFSWAFARACPAGGVDGATPSRSRAPSRAARSRFCAPSARPIGMCATIGGARLGDIIELTRLQAHWCEDSGIELFAEGDVYPRDRAFPARPPIWNASIPRCAPRAAWMAF